MIISYLYEGDAIRLGGFVVTKKRISSIFFNSIFSAELVLNRKKYDCKLKMRKWGGWEIIDFDKKEEAQEVLDYQKGVLTSDASLVISYLLRIVARFMIYLFSLFIPLYFVRYALVIGRIQIAKGICAIVFVELFLYFIRGWLNKI